jgi:hypothetical protein
VGLSKRLLHLEVMKFFAQVMIIMIPKTGCRWFEACEENGVRLQFNGKSKFNMPISCLDGYNWTLEGSDNNVLCPV